MPIGWLRDFLNQAVSDYLDENYIPRRISDWVRGKLEVAIDPEQLTDEDALYLERRIREKAKDEIRDAVSTSLGEYIDEEAEPAAWDVGGLLKWAQRLFPVATTQNQMRKMQPLEIEEMLIEAATRHYDEVDLTGIEAFLDPMHGRRALTDWVRAKFTVEIKVEEIAEGSPEQVAGIIRKEVEAAYERREREYPAEWIVSRAFSSGGGDNVYALQQIAGWANGKYRLDWTPEQLTGRGPGQILRDLVAAGTAFTDGGKLEAEVDEALRQHSASDNGELSEWALKRFGKALNGEALKEADGDAREVLITAGKELARWELTQLERYVLLRIYDQGWKDHLLEMDHLKHAIMQRPLGGDQTHPQSQYAIEGREQFDQMWKTIRDRVTDMIFKVSAPPEAAPQQAGGTVTTGGGPGGPAPQFQLQHGGTGGIAAAAAAAAAENEAGMRAQGEASRPQTIRRDVPKVGRNDPCPCGSGKKYKQCHGKQ